MSEETKKIVEEIRQEQNWDKSDAILVIRIPRNRLTALTEVLEKFGLKDNDAVEVIPQ